MLVIVRWYRGDSTRTATEQRWCNAVVWLRLMKSRYDRMKTNAYPKKLRNAEQKYGQEYA